MKKRLLFLTAVLILTYSAINIWSRVKLGMLPHQGDSSVSSSAEEQEPDSSKNVSISEFSFSEIQAALARLDHIPNSQRRLDTLCALMRRWAELDGSGAFDYAVLLNGAETQKQVLMAVAEELSRLNPQLLAEKLLVMPTNSLSGELIHRLAVSWAQSDVRSALVWAGRLPENGDKEDALITIRSQWAEQYPEEASKAISLLSESSPTARLISITASHWGETDPAKALAWINTLSENQRALAVSEVVGSWARRDPVSAGNYVAQLPSGEMQDEAARAVLSTGASKNPQETAAWAVQFPAGDLQEQGIRLAVSAWNSVDSAGVQTWASNLPVDQTRDTVMKSLVETIAFSNPDKAIDMISLINDPGKQEQCEQAIVRYQSQIDQNATQDWVAGLHVSDEIKARLKSFIPTN